MCQVKDLMPVEMFLIKKITGLLDHFKIPPIVKYDITNMRLMKMKTPPMLNNDEQHLKHPICENIDKKVTKKKNGHLRKIELNSLDRTIKRRKYNI